MLTRKVKKLTHNTVIVCLLAAGLIYVCSRFFHPGVEYTDNAQVKQHITPVNTRVQGFIQRICFDEYKPVRKGDTLVIIEDTEFRLRLARPKPTWPTPWPDRKPPRPASPPRRTT